MRIFMTGATGFIGSHLCRRLAAEGHSIVALVRDPDKARDLPLEEVITGDLNIFRDVDLALPPCDAVIHLAGALTAADDDEHFWSINYDALVAMVGCLERQPWRLKRFIFASSLAAAGPTPGTLPRVEDDLDDPIEPYGQSKLKAERFLEHCGFPVTVVRPPMVIGPGDDRLVPLFRMARKQIGFRIAGERQPLSYIYIDDLVDAIVLLLSDSDPGNKTYYVSHPRPVDNHTIWRLIGESIEKRVFVAKVPRPLLWTAFHAGDRLRRFLPTLKPVNKYRYRQLAAPGWVCDSSALQSDFGWQPRTDFLTGIRETAKSYRETGVI